MGRRRAWRKAAAAAMLWQALAASGAESPLMGTDVLLKDARFRAALATTLGARAKERWIATLANSGPVVEVRLDGETWLQATPCKPHDCADHNLLLLYSRGGGSLIGVLHTKAGHLPVGDPAPARAAVLERMWKKEFRQP